MRLAFPPFWQPHGLVRAVAPSGFVTQEKIEAGARCAAANGARVLYDDALFASFRYLAGDDATRLKSFETALSDPSAMALWAARGGYGAARLLPHLSVTAFGSAKKWLIGFSDVTALHALSANAGLGSLHAAVLGNLTTWDQAAQEEMFSLLFGSLPSTVYAGNRGEGPAVKGYVWGGNLTVLASLVGTGFLPRFAETILFIEDVNEKPYRLDRALWQLHASGSLANVIGVAIGQLTDCAAGGDAAYTAFDVVHSFLSAVGLPFVSGLPIGHEATSRALYLGAPAILDPAACSLVVQRP